MPHPDHPGLALNHADDRRRTRRQHGGRRDSDKRGTLRPRVLLVEPHDDTRALYATLLEEAGLAVYAVADGPSAMIAAPQRLPDIVILEVATPVPDGLALLRALRAGAATADVPAIVVTGMLHFDVPERAREAGATVVLAKPMAPDVILHAIDELLAATPPSRFARRQLRRSLLTLGQLGTALEPNARARVGQLIDRLQIAVLAVDDEARCLAVSPGFESLTGYARGALLSHSLFDAAFGPTLPLARRWDRFVSEREDIGDVTMRVSDGRDLMVQMALVTITPGLHLAAFAQP